MTALIVALALAATPFPLPSIDGKPLAVTEKQKVFRLPMRFEKVRSFYEERYGAGKEKDVTFTVSGSPGSRKVLLASKRKGDTWTRAEVKEGEVETVVEVTPVLRMEEIGVSGNGKPLVEFIISRSPEVDNAVKSIDGEHLERIRQ